MDIKRYIIVWHINVTGLISAGDCNVHMVVVIPTYKNVQWLITNLWIFFARMELVSFNAFAVVIFLSINNVLVFQIPT